LCRFHGVVLIGRHILFQVNKESGGLWWSTQQHRGASAPPRDCAGRSSASPCTIGFSWVACPHQGNRAESPPSREAIPWLCPSLQFLPLLTTECEPFKLTVLFIRKTRGSPAMGEPYTTRYGADSATDYYMSCLMGRAGFEPTRRIYPTDCRSSPISEPQQSWGQAACG
jgi:hypothetical protein